MNHLPTLFDNYEKQFSPLSHFFNVTHKSFGDCRKCKDELNFASPSETYPLFSQLLGLEEYRYHVLLGFSVSVGGLTESLVSKFG